MLNSMFFSGLTFGRNCQNRSPERPKIKPPEHKRRSPNPWLDRVGRNGNGGGKEKGGQGKSIEEGLTQM